jgi:hypothetical protein
MLKNKLLLGAAVAALGLIPMAANAQGVSVELESEWDNDVDVEVEWNVDVDKYIDINGDISIDGSIDVAALAHATHDNKQIIDNVQLNFEDYQNAEQDGDPSAEPNPGLTDTADDAEGAPTEAQYDNSVTSGDNSANGATGNVGINLAAGDFNLQENAAVLAHADAALVDTGTDGIGDTLQGAAEAGSFILQSLNDVEVAEETFELENSDIDNSVNVGSGTLGGASGNIGLNAAAGAFNLQKNALVIASVNGGNLAEATAAIHQNLTNTTNYHEDTVNGVAAGALAVGASGNIGVNLAAGFMNMQVNSLTIANALASGDTPGPTPDPTPAPTPDPTPVPGD